MAIEKVREQFKDLGIESKIQEFDVSSATVDLAAAALGCQGRQIAKTMAFKAGDDCILIVCAGDTKIDNPKYKSQFGTKAVMLKYDEVLPMVGHQVGGVCPFAVNEGVEIYLDESLRRFETVFPACGSANSAAEFTIPELEKYSNFTSWIDVCKITE